MRVSIRGRVLFVLFVVGLRIIENFLYFKKYGPLSSSAADIWFFIGVARGDHRLFGLDPLQWFLPVLGGCSTNTLFTLLLILSNGLHLAALGLLIGFLREVYQDEGAALWSAAGYACLSTSCLFCTGSFHHQQEALPILIGLMWAACRFLNVKDQHQRNRAGAVLACLAVLGLCVGPDVLVLFAAAIPCGIAWRLRNLGTPVLRLLIGTLALGLMVGIMIFLGPTFSKWVASLAWQLRGIDLLAQQQLNVGDLMPFGWGQFSAKYSLLGLGLILLVGWIWSRGCLVEIAFLLTGILFAARAGRFYFVVEIGLAILIGHLMAREIGFRRWVQNSAGALMVLLFLSAEIWRGFSCLCPGILPSILQTVQQDRRVNKLVFCTPTYGFLVRGASGVKPTSDMHHLDSSWVKLAAQPAADAITTLRKRGVTHLLLTSYDFQMKGVRMSDGSVARLPYASGGFEYCLSELTEMEMRQSLVYQAWTENFQKIPISGATLLGAGTDPSTQLKVVLYRLE